ncbi:hypothetical protein ZWY2020_009602 [Hordeum vulgare]|nr:hypothetical protein ZWY2020_009602 [Hordeum vulgare]
MGKLMRRAARRMSLSPVTRRDDLDTPPANAGAVTRGSSAAAAAARRCSHHCRCRSYRAMAKPRVLHDAVRVNARGRVGVEDAAQRRREPVRAPEPAVVDLAVHVDEAGVVEWEVAVAKARRAPRRPDADLGGWCPAERISGDVGGVPRRV